MAISIGLQPRRALLNDINSHVIYFYRWLKRGFQITLAMENDSDLYYAYRQRFNQLIRSGQADGNATGINLYQFSMPRNGTTTLQEARALLKGYGIPTFRLLHNHENFYFSVKRNQARWAEYLLYQKGIQLGGPTFDVRNAGYTDLHEPGYMPKPWSENDHSTQPDQATGNTTAGTEQSKKGGVSRLHSHLDRIDAIFLNDDEPKVIRTRGCSQAKDPHSQDHARRPTDWFDQMNALIDRW